MVESAAKLEIDVLVNNAGIMETGPVAEIPMDNVRKNFETNVYGTLAVTQAFVPQMVKRGSGKIIIVSLYGRFDYCSVLRRVYSHQACA